MIGEYTVTCPRCAYQFTVDGEEPSPIHTEPFASLDTMLPATFPVFDSAIKVPAFDPFEFMREEPVAYTPTLSQAALDVPTFDPWEFTLPESGYIPSLPSRIVTIPPFSPLGLDTPDLLDEPLEENYSALIDPSILMRLEKESCLLYDPFEGIFASPGYKTVFERGMTSGLTSEAGSFLADLTKEVVGFPSKIFHKVRKYFSHTI
jgi:hypothetical protein